MRLGSIERDWTPLEAMSEYLPLSAAAAEDANFRLHTGARALRDYYETIVKQEISPAITPDGPRFKRRLFLYDSRIIETLLVIPL